MSSPGRQVLASTFIEGLEEIRIMKTLLVTAHAFC